MPKPNGEVLVFGDYYAPQGQPITAGHAQVQVGPINKSLSIVGNRYWGNMLGPTAPEPFIKMPINYQHAFGGSEYKPNPVGKGMDKIDVFGEQRLPMPNIEDPKHIITSMQPLKINGWKVFLTGMNKFKFLTCTQKIFQFKAIYPLSKHVVFMSNSSTMKNCFKNWK